jgi:hypothetical protein
MFHSFWRTPKATSLALCFQASAGDGATSGTAICSHPSTSRDVSAVDRGIRSEAHLAGATTGTTALCHRRLGCCCSLGRRLFLHRESVCRSTSPLSFQLRLASAPARMIDSLIELLASIALEVLQRVGMTQPKLRRRNDW